MEPFKIKVENSFRYLSVIFHTLPHPFPFPYELMYIKIHIPIPHRLLLFINKYLIPRLDFKGVY